MTEWQSLHLGVLEVLEIVKRIDVVLQINLLLLLCFWVRNCGLTGA